MAKTKRANDEGTIHYRKDRKRYEARITVETKIIRYDEEKRPDGTVRRRPVYKLTRRTVIGHTRKEALDRLESLRKSLVAGPDMPAEPTVADFMEHWLTNVLPSTVTPSTAVNYRNVVKTYLLPHLETLRLDELTPAHVRQMMTALAAKELSPNTIRLARSVLRRALRTAEADGLVTRNVAAIVDGVRVPRSEGRTLTPEQARTLLSSLQGHEHEALVTVLLTLDDWFQGVGGSVVVGEE